MNMTAPRDQVELQIPGIVMQNPIALGYDPIGKTMFFTERANSDTADKYVYSYNPNTQVVKSRQLPRGKYPDSN